MKKNKNNENLKKTEKKKIINKEKGKKLVWLY